MTAEELSSVNERYEALEASIRTYNPNADFDKIRRAFAYARDKHIHQRRKDGSPYITHPLAVAQVVSDMHLDSESIMAALLHDCIEDTDATHEEIAKLFSPAVAELVEGVTKLTRVQYVSKEEEQMENLRKMLMAMSKDIRVILVKIADRLHNMRTMDYQTAEKQKQKSLETMEIYAPLAHRLGMQKVKWELEDRSLRYLDPVGYRDINDRLEVHRAEHEAFMAHIQSQIEERLKEIQVDYTKVYGRIKHTYSIYRKMYSQGKTLEQIYDLFAFRVIVKTIPDCYNVLGVMHDLYKPVLGRFKDYIGTPKPNMYQSLHTTVIGDEGIPFEVQIRTEEMHQIAEYGIAAHWKYKQNGQGAGSEHTYEWVRKLLENQESSDAEEFIHNLKVDMFADEVFVFTPSGDVVNLPAGATPIDFAYSIHSAVGNSMVSCKVNNRIVTFDYPLQNGDIVEVVTSKAAHGPSRDWMNIAKSSEARNKIRQWFKKEKREENVARGKLSFDSELKHAGLTLSEITTWENLPAVLKKMSYGSIDDLYAAIGYGGLSSLKAVNRIRDELWRERRTAQAAQKAAEMEELSRSAAAPTPAPPVKRHSENGVIVEGLGNCLVKFAKCCAPVPGDPIVGFVTRGYGVSVHRADCPNARHNSKDPEEAARWVKVAWGSDTRESYQTSLELVSKDRDGLVLDISAMLSTAKVRVLTFSSRGMPDGFAITSIVLEVTGSEQLELLMKKLKGIQGVMDVKRPTG
ncbi:bifunctional (p)ppGpp synthetase/guanosine-3',5'-bis(diphosphate) 3'-pyrophosphohydrolase [bacterium 210917-DFI.7.65]|nr:bifunctional (p)ppGpp synthetase/guanosine-3',5'-bis(diphosphate) 3'-pyrophosphohydrolase [Clostridiales bacterium]MCB6899618.1 bifunctional (p)ppGpp synthetase/guanosine-3',5'-bis(diphosphate) 3'-pyrophosphohydrolase [bacterium 210917-DFI.7.65]